MASTTQTLQLTKPPPNFTFPPRYLHNGNESLPKRKLQGLSDFPMPKSLPATKEDTLTCEDILPCDETLRPTSGLLNLPLEVRLQIYREVLFTHPVFHAHLAPPPTLLTSGASAPVKAVEELHTAFLRPLGQSLPTTQVLTTTTLIPATRQPISTLYPQSIPTIGCNYGIARGKIPTALLTSCRQVYEEARLLPWELNTFAFVNWFWSGLYASRQFTRGLRSWQCSAMRWVSLEVLTRDLTSKTATHERDAQVLTEEELAQRARSEWAELCTLWEGVWSLRLGLKGSIKAKSTQSSSDAGFMTRPEELSLGWVQEQEDKGVLDVQSEWVQQGLLKMKSLRWLELELEDENVDRSDKMAFCQELEEEMNKREVDSSQVWKDPVKVVFVEKTKAPELDLIPNLEFEWFGGQPGNDSIDGSY